MTRLFSLPLLAAVAWAATGCGGSSSAPASGPAVSYYYVADTGNARIVRYESFVTPTGWQTFYPPSMGTTPRPTDMVFDNIGTMYVVDQANNAVGRLNNDFATGWTTFTGTSPTTTFSKPTGIAMDVSGRLYIADSGNHRIVRIDDISGTNWTSFPAPGSASSPFVNPYGVAIDSGGNIWVTDSAQNAVYEMSDMNGDNLTALKSISSSRPNFSRPEMMSFDFQGRLYIADSGNNRIVRMTSIQGQNLNEWDSGGVVSNLSGVTLLGRDQILMTDTGHDRVYRILDITGSSPSYLGILGAGTNDFNDPLSVRAH